MNIVHKIEERLQENKSGVKTYATYEAAVGVADRLMREFDQYNGTNLGTDYVVTFLPITKRWTVVFNLSGWAARSKTGTYLGWYASKGFFSI